MNKKKPWINYFVAIEMNKQNKSKGFKIVNTGMKFCSKRICTQKHTPRHTELILTWNNIILTWDFQINYMALINSIHLK